MENSTVAYWLHQWNNVGDEHYGVCIEYGEIEWASYSVLIIYTECPNRTEPKA
jgi:hypothetical protein